MSDISKIQLKGTNDEEVVYNIKDETARNSIEYLNNTLLKPKKYVFMGDSYGDGYTPDGNVTSWITLLVQKMNLSSGDYISTHKGGYRFAYSSSDYNYIKLLNALTSDNDLTDMYVCGGYNDNSASENDILLGIQNFNTLFQQKFPNAKLHIGFIGWSKNGGSLQRLPLTFKYYKKSCESLQIDFLDGCEYALHNYYKYFASDGVHPNQIGQNSIANALYDCIIKGKANVIEIEGFYFQIVGGGISNSNTRMILNNGIVTAIMNGGPSNAMAFTFKEVVQQSGNIPLKIADITNSLAVGTDYNDCLFQGVPCVVYDGSTYSTKVLNFIIKNGEMYIVNAGASGGNYQTIKIKAIQIPSAMFSMSALNC